MEDIEQLASHKIEEIEEVIHNNDIELNSEELMNEISIIVEEYNEFIDNKSLGLESHSEKEDLKKIRLNKGFFLDKARNFYFKKNNLTDDKFERLSSNEKNIHRTGITKVYEKLMKEAETIKIQNYSSNPFGVVRRKEIESELEKSTSENEPITEAQMEWIEEQIDFYKEKIEAVDRMIKDFEKSISLEKVSGQLYWATQEKITELENEKKELSKQLNQYLVQK